MKGDKGSEGSKDYKDKRSNPLWLLGCLLLFAAVIEWSTHYSLPKQLRSNNDSELQTDFSVARARENLQGLTVIGPRVTGSQANEYTTPSWLMDKLQKIQALTPEDMKLEVLLQTHSSSFYIDFLGGMNNVSRQPRALACSP